MERGSENSVESCESRSADLSNSLIKPKIIIHRQTGKFTHSLVVQGGGGGGGWKLSQKDDYFPHVSLRSCSSMSRNSTSGSLGATTPTGGVRAVIMSPTAQGKQPSITTIDKGSSEQSLKVLCSKLIYKMGQNFLDLHYTV